SWFGSMADPLADKMLLIASYVVLGLLGHIPLELTYLVVGRDVLIFAGALWIWVYVRHFEATPTLLGKLCTFLMIVQALLVLTSLALFELPAGLLTTGNILVALSCIVSGAQYIFLGVSEAKTVKVTPR
ncbi:MAG: CDP-alcohol phosphatidyltransferase, partial [Moraxellaceae bacterium]